MSPLNKCTACKMYKNVEKVYFVHFDAPLRDWQKNLTLIKSSNKQTHHQFDEIYSDSNIRSRIF